MSGNNQSRWKTVEHSRSQIIKAGKIIRREDATDAEIQEATAIIDNWRAAHAYPLHVFYVHLRRMAEDHPDIIVAERLKRLDSIIAKLKREPNMSLWTMQDLGGARFVVPTVEDVFAYVDKISQSSIRHRFVNVYDYISSPKKSGYRSVHLVYEYQSDRVDTYNKNMLIELQFRTQLQHIWATALETMGLFTKQALKAGQGSGKVIRFFVLIASLFAMKEKQPIIPGTEPNQSLLIKELREINGEFHYLEMLSAIRVAIDNQDSHMVKNGYSILILNYKTRRLKIRSFKPSQHEEANLVYKEIESTRASSQIDAVLVRVASFQALKAAYPNYFSDIGDFIDIVSGFIYYTTT